MESQDERSLSERLAFLSPHNSVGGTILLVLAVGILCAIFSTVFWWIR